MMEKDNDVVTTDKSFLKIYLMFWQMQEKMLKLRLIFRWYMPIMKWGR